jgi:hypothetical protein
VPLSSIEAIAPANAAPCENPIIPMNGPYDQSTSQNKIKKRLAGGRCGGHTSSCIIFPIKSRLSSNPLIVLVCSSANPHDQNCQSSSFVSGASKYPRLFGFAVSAGRILCGAVGKTRSIPTRSKALRSPVAFLAKLGPVCHLSTRSHELWDGGVKRPERSRGGRGFCVVLS